MNNKNKFACIGQGFVGGSLTTVMSERGFDVFTYDKAGKVAEGGIKFTGKANSSISEFVHEAENQVGFSKIYFVCLPTPMFEDGSCDLSIVSGVLQELANIKGERIAVVKSTVPPGSTEKWNDLFNQHGLYVIHNPEFLREATALDDMRNQDRIILGGPRPHINKVKQLYQMAFPNVKIVKTSSSNSEMCKYVINVHLAMKVSLANEFYQICDKLSQNGHDIDYDRVIELATLDKRLGTSHWKVPSFEVDDNGNPLFGFSLSCFCKDINSLMAVARKNNIDPKVMSGGWEKNLEVRPGRDWEKLVGRAVSEKK